MGSSGAPPSSVAPPPPAGRGNLVANRYRIERKIGAGGMGVVVAAIDEQTGNRVALKLLVSEASVPRSQLLQPDGADTHALRHRQMAARMEREAAAASRLSGPHATRVLELGRTEAGEPFIVMEHLEGEDLGRYVRERGALPVRQAVSIMLQATDAIIEAHDLHIIHRDLKPGNLFITTGPDGAPFVKVLDFGISKILGNDDPQLTATSDMLGSPLYMAPEQIRDSRDVDGRSDVWSLGAILYRLLAGRGAFDGDGSAAALAAVLVDKPKPLTSLRADIPAELDAIVSRCLEKDRTKRVRSARDLRDLLAPLMKLPEGQVRWIAANAETPSLSPNAVTATETRPRSKGAALILGLGMAFALVAGGVAALKVTSADPAPPTAAASAPAASGARSAEQAPSAAPTSTLSEIASATTTLSGIASAPSPSAEAPPSAAPSGAGPTTTSGPKKPRGVVPRVTSTQDALGDRL